MMRRSDTTFSNSLIPPTLLVGLAIASVQLGSSLAVILFNQIDALGIVFMRVGVSALALGAVSRPFRDRSLWRHSGLVLIFGLDLAIMLLAYYEAIARIPMGIASTIEFVGPLALATLNSRRASHFAWIALAVAGVAILTPEIGPKFDPLGVLFALIAALAWAGFVILSQRIGRILRDLRALAAGTLVASIILFPFSIADGSLIHARPLPILGAAVVAILSTVVPLTCEFKALQRLSARTYGILIALEPAAAALAGSLLLGQRLGYGALAAIALVTIAAIGATLTDRNGGSGRTLPKN